MIVSVSICSLLKSASKCLRMSKHGLGKLSKNSIREVISCWPQTLHEPNVTTIVGSDNGHVVGLFYLFVWDTVSGLFVDNILILRWNTQNHNLVST